VRNYVFDNNSWTQRGNEIETWRNSRLGSKLALSSVGETIFAFPVIYSFNTTLLSTKNYLLDNEISLFPNPTTTTFKVDISNTLELKEVTIFNVLGKQVLKSRSSSIDISSFQKGIYFTKIITNKGFITKKLIKN
jgi:hypothetical protein